MTKAKAEYTVVARRYRPQQFDDLIGQEAVAQALRNALTSDRVAHAYLFTGARGVGKTSTARILAKALNCEKGPTPTPCDKCTSCLAIAAGDDIDVREIDGASNRGIDDIRAIRQDVSTRPTRSRYKIYIIDEVHMLSKDAFNALLKTLEEPPPHVKFIFATTEVQKVPITILSRCQRFDFGNISGERIAKQLRAVVDAEKMTADDDALELIARRAGGSMRDAQSLLDQLLAFGGERLSAELVQHLLGVPGPERVLALAEAVFAHDAKLALARLQEFVDAGLSVGELLDQLIDHWRDLMLVACAGKDAPNLNTPGRFRAALEQQAAAGNLDTVLAGLDILVSAKSRLRGSGQAQTLVQMALIRLCRLDDLTPLSQLAMWLSQPGSAPVGPGQTPKSGVAASVPVTLPPEGKKKPLEAETAIPGRLKAETLPVVWPEVIAQLGLTTGGSLQKAGLPAIFGPNALVLSFPPEYNAAYEHCSGSANVQRLEAVLKQVTGQAWSVRVEKRPGPAGGANGTANGDSPRSAAASPPAGGDAAAPDPAAGHGSVRRVASVSRCRVWLGAARQAGDAGHRAQRRRRGMTMFKELGQFASIMKNMGKIKEEAERFQSKLGEIHAEGAAGGDMVTVKVNGRMEILSVKIAESAPLQDREMLEDLICAAANQAMAKVREQVSREAQNMATTLGLPPGTGLPGLG